MQWLINLVAERVIATIGIPPTYIDRGDVEFADWNRDDLTIDGAWHELDVSAIVPANASAILFNMWMEDGVVHQFAGLRKSGRVYAWMEWGGWTQVGGAVVQQGIIVPTSPNGKVEYLVHTGMDWIFFTVRGWWL
ncbi:hypothetical protein ES703_19088 [subsurface metagenome]